MHADITTTPASPCIVTGGERIFARACRSCSAFALSCFPDHPNAAGRCPKAAPVIAAEDLKAMQEDCAGSPCLATGGSRTFSGACRSCPAFGLWCFPARPAVA
jgi:cytochrome c5